MMCYSVLVIRDEGFERRTPVIQQTMPFAAEGPKWLGNLDDLGEAKTILLVEDEAFVRQVAAEVLRAEGHTVVTARNAVEAREAFHRWGSRVDLLLTDVVLPGDSGRQLSMQLRRENPRLRVLLVTGYAEQMALPETAKEECLAKPFCSHVLLDRVRKLLDCSALQNLKEDPVTLACDVV